MKSYYETLEISPSATDDEIKEQYRFLIQAWHPDKFSNPAQKTKALEKAKEINQAFEVLGKPEKRRQYDRELASQGTNAASSSSPAQPAPAPSSPSQPPPDARKRQGQYRRTGPPARPHTGISPLYDFKWLLAFGDEYTYVLDDREAEALDGGGFQYRLSDWPVQDSPQARTSWTEHGYQVEVLDSPFRLLAGESSRSLSGQGSLTSATVTLDREATTGACFGLLLNLSYVGDEARDRRLHPEMLGQGIPNAYYSFYTDREGAWEFRAYRDWTDSYGILIERGIARDVQRLTQRGYPVELCAALRDSPPPDQDKIRVRLGINHNLVCDLFTAGHAWRRGGIMVSSPSSAPGETQRFRFSEFQSFFLAQR